jgi:hypothetical protein
MTDEEIAEAYDRAEQLFVQITTVAKERFGHFAALGMPPTMVLLPPDGEHTMHDLARAREAARLELGEITIELLVREKQMAHVKAQKSSIARRHRGRLLPRIVGGAVGPRT